MNRQNVDQISLSEFVERARKRARQHMERGAVTPDYGHPVEQVVGVLNEVLATEIVCALRYLSHVHQARGLRAEAAVTEFQEHADQELQHMSWIAARIAQLGGVPDFDPSTLASRAHADFVSTDDLREMVCENLVAERIAVDTYRHIAAWLGDHDPTTRRLVERILEQEEEHADDMAALLAMFDEATPDPAAPTRPDPVDVSSRESFPASDAPSWTPGRT